MTNVYKSSPVRKTIQDNEDCHLSVNMDCKTDPNNPKDWEVVIHFSVKDADSDFSWPENAEHHHIGLSQEEAKQLHGWLGKFLENTR